MTEYDLGGFQLLFEPQGKLRQLTPPGGAPLLHETEYRWDLPDGRAFYPGGWDECFPSIEAHGASPVMGDLIGRAPVLRRRGDGVEQEWSLPGYTARRRFHCSGGELTVTFDVEYKPMVTGTFLWASHALFSVRDLVEVALPDGTQLTDFEANGTCSKTFVRSGAPVVLLRREGRVQLETDRPWWGIWYNRGGWPASRPAGFACLGIEATTTASDLPEAGPRQPLKSFHGYVRVRCV